MTFYRNKDVKTLIEEWVNCSSIGGTKLQFFNQKKNDVNVFRALHDLKVHVEQSSDPDGLELCLIT